MINVVALNSISNIGVSRRCFGQRLRFQWNITALHKPSQIRVLLPQSLPISFCLARQLRTIIGPNERYSVLLSISCLEFDVPLELQ